MIRDLGSKNGTFVNDMLISGWKPGIQSNSVELKNDVSVKVGYNTTIHVIIQEETMAAEE